MLEQIQTNGQDPANNVSEAFANAEEAIYSIIELPEFAHACLQSGLDPKKSVNTPGYWGIVADFALENIGKRRADGEDSLELAAQELSALTPSFLFASKALANREFHGYKEMRALKEQTSYFNSLLRYAGTTFPDLEASEVAQSMANTAAIAGLRDQETSKQIRWTIRGAQHELAFGQILGHTGRSYQEAPLELDLRGADYTVEMDGGTMLIDVKASLSEVEALGGEASAFAFRHSRNSGEEPTVVMYSLTRDSEFEDRFVIPDEVAASKAETLDRLLQDAELKRNAA